MDVRLEWIGPDNWEILPQLRPLVDKFKVKAKSSLSTDAIMSGMLRCVVDRYFRVLVASNGSGPILYAIVQIAENPPWCPRTLYILQAYSETEWNIADTAMKEVEKWARENGVQKIVIETKRFDKFKGFKRRFHLTPATAMLSRELKYKRKKDGKLSTKFSSLFGCRPKV